MKGRGGCTGGQGIEAVSHRTEERLRLTEAVEHWNTMHVPSLKAPSRDGRPLDVRDLVSPQGAATQASRMALGPRGPEPKPAYVSNCTVFTWVVGPTMRGRVSRQGLWAFVWKRGAGLLGLRRSTLRWVSGFRSGSHLGARSKARPVRFGPGPNTIRLACVPASRRLE